METNFLIKIEADLFVNHQHSRDITDIELDVIFQKITYIEEDLLDYGIAFNIENSEFNHSIAIPKQEFSLSNENTKFFFDIIENNFSKKKIIIDRTVGDNIIRVHSK